MTKQYSEAAKKLLAIGDCRKLKEWPNYLDLGFNTEHVKELINMACDTNLFYSEEDTTDSWSPIHAWRVLGQLKAKEAVEPLTKLFHEFEDNDWAGEELPEIYGMIGKEAIPSLSRYLFDDTNGSYPRVTAAHSLERIADMDPTVRDECVSIITKVLENFEENDIILNSLIIGYLVDLKATESLPTIEEAFAANKVDCAIQGDFEDVQIALGVKETREKERTYKLPFSELAELILANKDRILKDEAFSELAETKTIEDSDWPKGSPQNVVRLKTKTKNKRSAQKNSRKKNRKRK